jgi:5'-3' exoribonuclease 2
MVLFILAVILKIEYISIYNFSQPQPSSEEEMFNSVFDYTDKLIKIIKPKKFLYIAIDGVAPRAKMNQQRSRRFRAAQEAMEKQNKEQALLSEWKSKGLQEPSISQKGFDSNVITPGTVFMHKLSKALEVIIYIILVLHFSQVAA